MNTDVIPELLQRFIVANIDSIAELEALLIFHADQSLQATAASLAARLYITKEESENLLKRLTSKEFISCIENDNEEPCYTYGLHTPETAQIINSLANYYSRCLVPITNLVHSKPRNSIQKFADAFWIRKD